MSIIFNLAESFTDTTIPVVSRDPIINPGTLFCWDFGTAFCWDPTAAVTNFAPIKNLVDTRPPEFDTLRRQITSLSNRNKDLEA